MRGASLLRAERRKCCRHPELADGPFGRLVVLACETGGRWNDASLRFVAQLAKHKARSAPRLLQAAARAAWQNRWWGLLSIAAQGALATTLLGEGALAMGALAGYEEVPFADVLEQAGTALPASRLPLR